MSLSYAHVPFFRPRLPLRLLQSCSEFWGVAGVFPLPVGRREGWGEGFLVTDAAYRDSGLSKSQGVPVLCFRDVALFPEEPSKFAVVSILFRGAIASSKYA